MSNVNSLSNYRKAKAIVKDIEQIIKHLNSLLINLEQYKRYRPVASLCDTIETSRDLLKFNYEFYQMVIETKGQVTKLDP